MALYLGPAASSALLAAALRTRPSVGTISPVSSSTRPISVLFDLDCLFSLSHHALDSYA
jgi:hypothetical protein